MTFPARSEHRKHKFQLPKDVKNHEKTFRLVNKGQHTEKQWPDLVSNSELWEHAMQFQLWELYKTDKIAMNNVVAVYERQTF